MPNRVTVIWAMCLEHPFEIIDGFLDESFFHFGSAAATNMSSCCRLSLFFSYIMIADIFVSLFATLGLPLILVEDCSHYVFSRCMDGCDIQE
jgi:hypothetical protein